MTTNSQTIVTTNPKLQPFLQEIPYTDNTNLRAGEYGNPLILNKVFALLVLMINQLQKTAAAQAQRLNFLTAWQKAYADQMNTIHVFVAQNGDNTTNPGGGSNTQTTATNGSFISKAPNSSTTDTGATEANTARGDLNTANQNYTSEMTANNGVVSNDAKGLQSVVNQTNDSVSSESDMATSVLQQLQTILTSIYQNAN